MAAPEQIPITVLVANLLESEGVDASDLARRLGVSGAAISRWRSGKSSPRAEIEGKLRALATRRTAGAAPTRSSDSLFAGRGERLPIAEAFREAMREIRESLHRHGRLSSRHEAIDELAKLVFAHFVSIETGGRGLEEVSASSRTDKAVGLREFVAEQFRVHLPRSMSHEIAPEDLQLRLKPSEDRLARELLGSFERLSVERVQPALGGAAELDLLNEVFGRFLADSFTDEKELGQYLTPPEVVRAMTTLGLASLTPDQVMALTDPSTCGTAGLILDPSCGVGSFLVEAVRQLLPHARGRLNDRELQHWLATVTSRVLVGVDKSDRMIRLALTSLALFGAPSAGLHRANSLACDGFDGDVAKSMDGRAVLILTNPPFGAEFPPHEVRGFELAHALGASERSIVSELLFLERYLAWLAPGGILVAVVPDSILTNRGPFAAAREWLETKAEIRSIISLPTSTFGAAGTTTKTSILHLAKRDRPVATAAHRSVYFGRCTDVGYDVVVRGSQRVKVTTGRSDLNVVIAEATGAQPPSMGQLVRVQSKAARWDAAFHAGIPAHILNPIQRFESQLCKLGDVAELITDRYDPRRSSQTSFAYIEISDLLPRDCAVCGKEIARGDAPGRARKRVQAGDILMSTVRPERRAIGVVPASLDGAVCSTGIAVLRPRSGYHGITIAQVLQSDFVNTQILRHNSGIAYPAIDEACLPDIVFPITAEQIAALSGTAARVQQLREETATVSAELCRAIDECIHAWVATPQSSPQTSSIVPNQDPSPTSHNGF